MNRKFLPWGIAIAVFLLNAGGARGQSYEFAVVSNSATAGANLDAVANNENMFVCVGGQNSPVLTANTNGFAAWTNDALDGGYLLYTNAWRKSPANFWFNCVAAQTNGFIASGSSNAVFFSSDGVTWNQSGYVLPKGDQAYACDGITYNPYSSTYAAALAVYVIEWANNPSANNWVPSTITGQSFAESFRSITSFAGSHMAVCGIFGDIRISADGGQTWNAIQAASLNRPSLLSVTSDQTNWTSLSNGSNLVCVGDKSTIEVSPNGGGSWALQTRFNNFGAPGTLTNFNAATYDSGANAFLAAGTVGANGLIVMAPEVPGTTNWTWTRQENLWSAQNGTLTTNGNILSGQTLDGASVANTNFFQGIAMLVGNNGAIVIGGTSPSAPYNTNSVNINVTNVLTSPPNNASLVATVFGGPNNPANCVAVDWFSTNSGGSPLALNSNPFSPTNDTCGAFTIWAQARDLRTGFFSSRTNFVFTIIPHAPTNAVMNLTNVLTTPVQTNSPIWVDLLVNADDPPADFMVNWYTTSNGLNNVNDNSDTNLSNRFFHTPTNATCGVFTYYAETVATNTPPSGGSLLSTNRTLVTFAIIPAAPTSLGNEVNCAGNGAYGMCSNVPLLVTVTSPPDQTNEVNWYDENSNLVAVGTLSYTPTNSQPGTYTYYAQATNFPTGLVSAWTQLTFQVTALPQWADTAEFYTNTLTSPNPSLTFPPPGLGFAVDWYTSSDPANASYENPNAPYAYGAAGIGTGTFGSFTPTNRTCGIYTYYARNRASTAVNTGCYCQSTNLVPVTLALLPPVPTDASVNLTNALTGATQTNTPIWVELFTNADNPFSSFVVNWYTTANSLNNINNNSETNLSNFFFHTPTNATCGVFTNWAEIVATNAGTGVSVVSSNRYPVVFTIVPATPTALTALGAFDQTNCIEVPNPTFTVTVTNGQTAEWLPSSGTTITNLSFTPTNSLPGTFTYSAQALDTNSELTSTGSVLATLVLSNCSSPLTINVNSGSVTGSIQWPGNLVLLSTTNITPPVTWTIVSTGSMFLAPNSITFTNTNPPTEFFRLTN